LLKPDPSESDKTHDPPDLYLFDLQVNPGTPREDSDNANLRDYRLQTCRVAQGASQQDIQSNTLKNLVIYILPISSNNP